ncbi:MAG: DUF547 domain-containing protein [Alphaproteobacteria bacterium]|jgi:hypothetical protein|nr:DUF547 domain-containing protein [Alphaproteobacteria bacterium]
MRRFLLAAWLGLACPLVASSAGAGQAVDRFAGDRAGAEHTVDHGAFAAFLARYRVVGPDGVARVRYADVAPADATRLRAYLARLGEVEVAALDRDAQLAFWLNLFNAAVVEVVLAHYPVASMRDIDLDPRAAVHGPWTAAELEVAGDALSLADIEDDILFTYWRDPRVHYALHRGSLGCPNLPAEPFTGADIDARLDAAAMAYVNHPRGVAIEGGDLVVSSLYRWFQDDFGGSEPAVLRHLKAFAEPTRAMRLQRFDGIDRDRYDWRLNDR